MLARDGKLSIVGAAQRLGVNPMTIRRDLEVLESSGVVVRCYGGAMAAHRISFEFKFNTHQREHFQEKENIATVAVERIAPGQVVMLDAGTTTLEIAKCLARKGVPCTVITSSLAVASRLWGCQQIQLMLVGGRVRLGNPDLVGPATEANLEQFTADIAFLGSDGIDPARGFFAVDVEPARVAEKMAACARQVIMVADSSKFGAAAAFRCVAPQDADELITDSAADPAAIQRLRQEGVTVTLV